MTAKEKRTILSLISDYARTIGTYSAERKTWEETESARAQLSAVKTAAFAVGISYEEITAAIDKGWTEGFTDHETRILYRDTENGNTVSRADLRKEFEELKQEDPETYDYTFPEYLANCTGKDGFLKRI